MNKPGPRSISYPPKICQSSACGKEFNRRRRSTGKLEPGPSYQKRKFCSTECAQSAHSAKEHVPTMREVNMIEDVKWIIGTDTPDSIAKRVGYLNAPYLIKTLERCKEYQLALKLARQHSQYLMEGAA